MNQKPSVVQILKSLPRVLTSDSLHLAPEPIRNLHLYHIAPLVMVPTCLWLFLSRLLRSLRQYETLNASLSRTITKKTNELEDSFAKLAHIKRRETIAGERDRTMLDPHFRQWKRLWPRETRTKRTSRKRDRQYETALRNNRREFQDRKLVSWHADFNVSARADHIRRMTPFVLGGLGPKQLGTCAIPSAGEVVLDFRPICMRAEVTSAHKDRSGPSVPAAHRRL